MYASRVKCVRSEHTVLMRVLEIYDSKNQDLYNTLDFCVLSKNDVWAFQDMSTILRNFPQNLSVNALQIAR